MAPIPHLAPEDGEQHEDAADTITEIWIMGEGIEINALPAAFSLKNASQLRWGDILPLRHKTGKRLRVEVWDSKSLLTALGLEPEE